MKDFCKKNKKISSLFLVVALVIVSFSMAHFAYAGAIDKAVSFVVGAIASLILVVCGWILGLAISGIITISSYNNFVNEPSVVQAWVIIRDLCNMFFILILLVIAFATILRVETYQWKKILPKLLIMAVLINFSKTICGLLIDFSQVIMLTFTNAFSDGGGNFVDALRVKDFLKITKDQASWWDGKQDLNLTTTVAAMMFVIILIIIATVTMLAIMVIFLMRMIMLWIYIILSPIAFLMMAFPEGQKYASQWWSGLVQYLINGPVLAFFVWLTLIVMNQAPQFKDNVFFDKATGTLAGGQNTLIQALQTGTFISFIMAIGMLVGGLMISQQIGGLGAAWGMNALSKVKSTGLSMAKKGGLLAGGGALMLGGWMGRKIKSGAISNMFAKQEVDAEGNVIGWKGRGKLGKFGSGVASALYGLELRPTKIIEGIKEGLKATAEKEEAQATGASAISLKKGGVGGLIKGLGVSRDLTESLVGPGGFLWHKGFRRVYESTLKGGPRGVADTEKLIEEKKNSRGVKQAEYDAKRNEYDENLKKRDEALKYGDKVGAGKINETLNKLWPEVKLMRSKIIDDSVRDNQDLEIEKLEKRLSQRKPIQTFYADRAREELISKSSKMLGDNDNEEFLQETLRDAIANGNKEVAQAVIIHAAKVSHLNEMMHGYRSKRDVYEWNVDKDGNKVKGKLLAKKGQALPQGGAGLNELIKQALIEDLGIDEQTAYATQSEASTLAKSVKHMNMAESVGSKNGFFYQRPTNGPGGQLTRAKGEARKVDAESFIRNYNRIGWGDEFVNPDGSRTFKLNAMGLDTFTELADIINKEIGGRRINKNAALNISEDADTLRAWAKKLEDGGIKYYDGNSTKADKMESYVELAEKLISYGKSVAQAQKGRSSSGEGIKQMQAEVLNNQKRP